ncbi:acyl dehydratase [Sphingomonas glacialis]|uniref:Acyl dehydratase n=1 Tax=Sphingomonas glacialis TaxID=658225 RepID=A0ABQ3LTZ1_9SPHN|nr:MaoC family dehydratase N-terminal domain-containing protein [Sphingomonas glacialis]GHH24000.1 acyl dehydratase [Sphingomonas glacialis]
MTDVAAAPSQTPALWEGALEEARSLIGVELRRTGQQWNTEAAPDAVRHFCWGLGDDNPLFTDPAYGASSPWKSALAPGCFLYTIDTTVVAPKLRGIQWLYGGTDFEWYEPIRHRDSFTVSARLLDAVEKEGGKAAKFIIQTGETLYTNQHGQLVCRAHGSTARTARSKASGGLSYAPRETHRYSPEELESIAHAVETEELRGAAPRFWEDVEIDSEIQPMLKGPLNITDMICWYSGGGHSYQAHRRAAMHRKRHPADAFINPETNAQDSAARGHTEAKMAREVGMPGGYDVGPQRISWLGQLMTNWIGDAGFLHRLNVSVRRPNIFGDVSWCRGRVVDKQIDGDRHAVDLELWVDNQLGDTTAKGTARVWLPSKNNF